MNKTNYLALKSAGHAFHRMTNQGLDSSVVRQHMDLIEKESDWFPVWLGVGERFRTLGEAKLAEGYGTSAGSLLTKAALAYHFAQYLHFNDLKDKERASRMKVQCFEAALPMQPVPGRRFLVKFEDALIPAIFRTPDESRALPLVVLVCGSDSSKEEHVTIEREFLSRGMATVSFDGPGQGELANLMPMRPDYHKAVTAVLDSALQLSEVDPKRIAVIGFGFGGMLAVGAACTDKRIIAAVSVSGYFDMSVMNWSDPIRAWRFSHIVGAKDIAHARQTAEAFDLASHIRHIGCPLLVLHGGADAGIPKSAAKRIADEAGDCAEFVEIEDGVHCFHNVSWKVNPLMADWLMRALHA